MIDCQVEADVWLEAGEWQKQDGDCRHRGSTANRQLAQSPMQPCLIWHISTHFSESLEKGIQSQYAHSFCWRQLLEVSYFSSFISQLCLVWVSCWTPWKEETGSHLGSSWKKKLHILRSQLASWNYDLAAARSTLFIPSWGSTSMFSSWPSLSWCLWAHLPHAEQLLCSKLVQSNFQCSCQDSCVLLPLLNSYYKF